jgi:hypothetical protein
MLSASMRTKTIAIVLTAAMLSLPKASMAGCCLCDWLFGKSCHSQPACGPACPAPAACPTTTYYAPYAPACAPVVPACTTCASPVVTYRPAFGFGSPARLVPYTTYSMPYTPVVPYAAYGPSVGACGSCAAPCSPCSRPCASFAAPCASCASPCTSCGTSCTTYLPAAPVVQAVPAPVMQAPAAMVPAPAAAMPALGPAASAPAPAGQLIPIPDGASGYGPATYGPAPAASGGAPSPTIAPPKTFEGSKPLIEQQPLPVPLPSEKKSTPGVNVNPISAPQLLDPHSRTAMLPTRQAARVMLIAAPAHSATALGNSAWQVSKD